MESTSQDKTAARVRMTAQLITLSILGWQAWMAFVPEHSRTLARMRAADLGRRGALAVARWAGRQGIAVEATTGAEHDAAAWYACARCLAQTVAARMQSAYDRARDQ